MNQHGLIKSIINLLVVLSLLIQPSYSQVEALLKENNITLLTDDNFSTLTLIDSKNSERPLRATNQWLILFYAGWCGHCKKLVEDAYQHIDKNLTSLAFPVKSAAIECPSNPQVCKDFLIAAYPTLIYFRQDGSNYTFPKKTDKTVQKLIQFVKASHRGEQLVTKADKDEENDEQSKVKDNQGGKQDKNTGEKAQGHNQMLSQSGQNNCPLESSGPSDWYNFEHGPSNFLKEEVLESVLAGIIMALIIYLVSKWKEYIVGPKAASMRVMDEELVILSEEFKMRNRKKIFEAKDGLTTELGEIKGQKK